MQIRTIAASLCLLPAAGCSGSDSNSATAGAEHNDTATGARLMRERPLGNGTPQERVARMAECAATLNSIAEGPPPHERAEYLRRTATRLVSVAEGLAARSGQSAADVARLRDAAAGANRQLARNRPDLYAQLIGPAENACYTAAILSDAELTG